MRSCRTCFAVPGPDVHADGRDVQYKLRVEFLAAVNGATSRVILPGGSALDVVVPAGTRDRQVLRLRGKGAPGLGGGKPGDALVEIEVKPHSFFTREGDDIRLTLPVSLTEAVLGAEVRVPTTTGTVSMRVPKGVNTVASFASRAKASCDLTEVGASSMST